MKNWIVLKFGGTSVANEKNWPKIALLAKEYLKKSYHPFLVCSALSGVSDHLEKIVDETLMGESEKSLSYLRSYHLEICNKLDILNVEFIEESIIELKKILYGITLTREASNRLRAQILAFGEMLSTKIGAEYLKSQNIDIYWMDATDFLKAKQTQLNISDSSFLSSKCIFDEDKELMDHLQDKSVVITQGFLASNSHGETVLLGRGGSDTSASYFAAKLKAKRCEIWTDVPGMFTSDPNLIPEAKLLKKLDYDEAQEMATTGAKVLHPRCLVPVRKCNIPIHIKSINDPSISGTKICQGPGNNMAGLKGICLNKKIQLISLETVNMWREVGYLAKLFNVFKEFNISIDLISTSETNITLSLDKAGNYNNPKVIQRLLERLKTFGEVTYFPSCVSVGLVGKKIRSILYKLTPVFKLLEEKNIHMVTQASNDLNLTIVMDSGEASRILPLLHHHLFPDDLFDENFGPTWKELNWHDKGHRLDGITPWWKEKKSELIKTAKDCAPVYVYDKKTILASVSQLQSLDCISKTFYAVKANGHLDILKTLESAGLGMECVSMEEVKFIIESFPEISRDRILFTPNFASKEEYAFALKEGIHLTVDSLYPLKNWPEIFKGKSILLRIDPENGAGHHQHVNTSGIQSKFGIAPDDLQKAADLINSHNIKVVGLHSHIGSGIFSHTKWRDSALFLGAVLSFFPEAKILNLGGGLGVPERLGQGPMDLKKINENLLAVKKNFPEIELWIEPGRYLVANSGVLLAQVTQIKNKRSKNFIGINTGMNSLIRPSLYGSYHEIFNLSKLEQKDHIVADIVGPICETGDTLGHSRKLPATLEGDIILIDTAGAYGRVMGSNYNRRSPAKEVFYS
jgi:diaminopimelate decarboxylase/aspartate kinase